MAICFSRQRLPSKGRMETRRRLVSAAPARVAAALHGPARTVPVVHAGEDATYVDVDGTVVGVLSARATAVPCGLRTTQSRLPAEISQARQGVLGGGRLRLGSVDVVCTRIVTTSLVASPPHPHARPSARLATALKSLPVVAARLDAVRAELPPEALEGLALGEAAAVTPLLGLGSGLTPVGDDVLCGWLATRVATGADPEPIRSSAVGLGPGRTTSLSATLLVCAGQGEMIPEFRRLLLLLGDRGDRDLDRRLQAELTALVSVGHTSGVGLLLGTLLAFAPPHVTEPHR